LPSFREYHLSLLHRFAISLERYPPRKRVKLSIKEDIKRSGKMVFCSILMIMIERRGFLIFIMPMGASRASATCAFTQLLHTSVEAR
jgi:hypothetical protein